MSTVFYGYRLKKRDLWLLQAKARDLYREVHPLWSRYLDLSRVPAVAAKRITAAEASATDQAEKPQSLAPGEWPEEVVDSELEGYFRTLESIDFMMGKRTHTADGKRYNGPDLSIEIQVFDLGSSYVVRVLEFGHSFMNNVVAHEDEDTGAVSMNPGWEFLTAVFLDTRSDTPPAWEKNRRVVDQIDVHLQQRRYLLLPIVSRDDVSGAYMDFAREIRRTMDAQADATPVATGAQGQDTLTPEPSTTT